jgi:hypothetical protein
VSDEATRERLKAIAAERARLDAEEDQLVSRALEILARRRAQLKEEERQLGGDESIALQPITKPAKVMSDMVDSHRVALSVSRVKRLKRDKGAPDGPFMTAIQAKGFTQATLAQAIGIKQPTLSAHRKPKGDPNSRPIPTARAQRIQELTGWPADSRHWPCGLSD